jgi:hypothetical protein
MVMTVSTFVASLYPAALFTSTWKFTDPPICCGDPVGAEVEAVAMVSFVRRWIVKLASMLLFAEFESLTPLALIEAVFVTFAVATVLLSVAVPLIEKGVGVPTGRAIPEQITSAPGVACVQVPPTPARAVLAAASDPLASKPIGTLTVTVTPVAVTPLRLSIVTL